MTKKIIKHARFSARYGHSINDKLGRENVSDQLRASIWNLLRSTYWGPGFAPSRFENIRVDEDYANKHRITDFSYRFWTQHLEAPIDSRPGHDDGVFERIKTHFFECEWFIFFDLIEFVADYYRSKYDDENLDGWINEILEEKGSAYRIIKGRISEITNAQEIDLLESALDDIDFPNVSTHLARALELLSDKKSPDYRNSIKESISAVESMVKEIAGKRKASLGDALKTLEKSHRLHPSLKQGFLNLYGFTSDADGIRHGIMDESSLDFNDAKYMLLTCTSFINYLKAKANLKPVA